MTFHKEIPLLLQNHKKGFVSQFQSSSDYSHCLHPTPSWPMNSQFGAAGIIYQSSFKCATTIDDNAHCTEPQTLTQTWPLVSLPYSSNLKTCWFLSKWIKFWILSYFFRAGNYSDPETNPGSDLKARLGHSNVSDGLVLHIFLMSFLLFVMP